MVIWIFENASGYPVFQRFQFVPKIVEILQKCSCSVDFLQEISFNHLVRDENLIT